MKKLNAKRIILIFALSLAMTLSITIALIFRASVANVNAYTLTPSTEIKTEYDLNTEFIVPSATFVNGGESVVVDKYYLVFPDNVARGGSQFILDQLGQYSLVYTSKVNGKVIKGEKNFIVKNALYSVTSTDSSLTFEDELLVASAKNATPQSGYKVSLYNTDTFTYNKPIDLNDLGDKELIHFYQHSSSKVAGDPEGKTIQCRGIIITLTDCYDSNNTVKIRWWQNAGWYVTAYTPSQQRTGAQDYNEKTATRSDVRTVEVDGQKYCMFYDSSFGFYGAQTPEYGGNVLFFNYPKKQLYINKDGKKKLLTDLDEPSIYDSKLFGGFTTGEVYLSISVNYFMGSHTVADLEITSIAGEPLSKDNTYIDDRAPSVYIDNHDGGTINVAKGESFKVPQAKYADVNGVKETRVLAFYGYGTANPVEVAIIDGQFTPNKLGTYTVVYSAKDIFGAETKYLLQINSINCVNDKSVQFAVNKVNDIPAGLETTLPAISLSSINDGEYCNVYLVNKATGEREAVENGKVLPKAIGAHELVYEYGDKYLNYVYSYEFNTTSSNGVFFSDIVMPEYFIKGYNYTIDEVTAITFDGQKEQTSVASVYVKEDGASEYSSSPINANSYLITATTSLQFKFVKGDKYIESSVIKVISVLDVNKNIDMKEYFVGNFTKTADTAGVTLTSNVTEGDNSFDFANVISASNFKLAIDIPDGKSNFDAVQITLKDYYDRNNVLEFSLLKDSKGFIKLGYGGLSTALGSRTFNNASCVLALDFEKKVVKEDTFAMDIVEEFTSDKVLLSVKLVGIYGNAGVAVKEINGQAISSQTADYVSSSTKFNTKNYGMAKFNSILTISKLEAIDVLTPYVKDMATVTVKDSSGNVVEALDGTKLNYAPAYKDYQFKATNYGRYNIEYAYTDQNYNYGVATSFYDVVDDVAPTLVLNDNAKNTTIEAKLNDKITIKGFTVEDNISKKEKISVWVTVQKPSMERIQLKTGVTTFVVDKMGTYEVRYFCMDEAGNYVMTCYYVNVK